MAEIVVMKRAPLTLTEAELEAVRRFLYEVLGGLGEANDRRWRRLWNWLAKAEPGELLTLKSTLPRSGIFHRRHMALEAQVFEGQERFEDFKAFRAWLKIGAGLVDWVPGPRGGIVPLPKSISYEAMEQLEFEAFHQAAVDFLRQDHAQKVLWPKAPAASRGQLVEAILQGFER